VQVAGALNIGAAPGSAPVAPGTLSTPTVLFSDGTGTLNFNHTATNYVFAPAISVSGAPPPPCPTRAELQDAN